MRQSHIPLRASPVSGTSEVYQNQFPTVRSNREIEKEDISTCMHPRTHARTHARTHTRTYIHTEDINEVKESEKRT